MLGSPFRATVSVSCPYSVQHRLRRRSSTFAIASNATQQNVFERAVNTLQIAVLKSPLNQGKIMFFKLLAGDYDEEATRAKIQSYVDNNPVMVFSWSVCPFAQRAQRILTEAGAKFKAIELDRAEDGKAIKAELGVLTGRTSVPSIWIQGQCIGGCNDGSPGLIPLKESGELLARLKQAEAL